MAGKDGKKGALRSPSAAAFGRKEASVEKRGELIPMSGLHIQASLAASHTVFYEHVSLQSTVRFLHSTVAPCEIKSHCKWTKELFV